MVADTFQIIAGKPKIVKDPQAVLDYSIDWTAWLALNTPGDALSTVVWTPDGTSGLTEVSSAFSGGIATVWLSGGTAGVLGSATCHITTTGGRQDERTLFFNIKDR